MTWRRFIDFVDIMRWCRNRK